MFRSLSLLILCEFCFDKAPLFGTLALFMASTCRLILVGIAVLSRLHCFSAVQPSTRDYGDVVTLPPPGGPVKNDLFDIAEGNQVTGHSGTFPTIRIAGMFGDEGPSVEKGSTLFADDRTNGFTHFVEWRTPSPIDLHRIKLFAAGDGEIYRHEREFQSFTLKTKRNPASASFDRIIYTYTATHPYTFVNPTNALLIDAGFDGIVAQEFRAEFVQWNAGRGYDGPRVIELDGFGERLQNGPALVADWTFEEGVPGAAARAAQDSSGNGHHVNDGFYSTATFVESGTEVNGAVSVRLPSGQGGFGNALRAADSVAFNLGTEFTLEASLNPGPDNAQWNRGILVGQDVASGRLAYALDYRSEARVVGFLIYNAQGEGQAVHATIPNDGKSHHVAGIFSSGVLRVYLDKQLVESQPTSLIPGIAPGGAGRVTLGANDIGGYWFNGVLDRVRISREALATEEFFPTDAEPLTPLVILQPLQNVTVAEGGSATFHVAAAGGTNSANLAYRWAFNGQTLSNETSDTLLLNNVRAVDAGTYTVTVRSGPWEVSSSATLSVTPGSADALVADWTFEEGVPGAAARAAQDSSGNGHHVNDGSYSTATFVESGTEVNGAVSVRLPSGQGGSGNTLRAADSVAFNLGTEFTLEASLNPGPDNAQWNRGILVGQDVASGRLAYALDYRSEARVVGFLIYNAQGEGQAVHATIPNDGKSHHIAGILSGGVLRIYLDKQLVESQPTSLIPGIAPGGAGRVTLGANDIGGYWFNGVLDRVRISREALATEEFFPTDAEPLTPLVILQPLQNVTVAEGGSATFHVAAAGGTNSANLAYRWAFNGQTLSNQTSDTLLLNNVRAVDAGTYTVTVRSGPWEVSSSATLSVTPRSADAPVITAHPQSRLAGVGLTAQFSVSATSFISLTYQWFFNGGAISGETNSALLIVNVGPEDAGTYAVTVRNSSGSVTSQPAVLNVFSGSAGGGTVYLDNRRPGVDAPVTDDRGLRVSGAEFLAQLYAAPVGQLLAPVGAAIPFGTGENAGYFSDPFERVIPGTTAGGQASMQVRVWDARAGRTYEEAAENGGLHGASNPMVDTVGGGIMIPATLTLLQPFSLAARPRITQQPADLSVKAGRTAVFEVGAAGTGPLTYQWKFNNDVLEGQTATTLVLSNVTEINMGQYSVTVSNRLGEVTSARAQLTVLPRDNQPPVVTLTSPAAGTNTAPRVTLAGTVNDNGTIAAVEWLRNGQLVGPMTLTNGTFTVSNVLLSPGTNQFTVTASDDDGNTGFATVLVTYEPQRAVWVESVPAVQEGARISAPIRVSSNGDIGALSFTLSYDTNYLAEPILTWAEAQAAFELVNTDLAGTIRVTYVLPGRTIRAGTNTLAFVQFRARSVPENLKSPLNLEVQGVFSSAGDPITTGTTVNSGEVQILQRKIVGDNNANDRLDVGDATTIIRMLTLLEPMRPWDVTGNDLNQNAQLDAGDAVRVLRAVVNLDRQPTVPGSGLQAQALDSPLAPVEISAPPYLLLTTTDKRLVAGQKIKVRLNLTDVLHPLTGASFQLNYPTNALRLENAEAHTTGTNFPVSAMALWNVSPGQDYERQDGQVSFAASSALPWELSSVAEFTFTVQPGATAQRFWPVTVSQGEIASGMDVESARPSELLLEGRTAQAANLSAGSFNPATGAFELSLTGDIGARYKIEVSDDLRAWTKVNVITADSGTIRVTDSPSTPVPHRFYRAVEIP